MLRNLFRYLVHTCFLLNLRCRNFNRSCPGWVLCQREKNKKKKGETLRVAKDEGEHRCQSPQPSVTSSGWVSIAQYKQLTSTVYIQDDFSGLEVTGTLKHRPHESILFLYQCFRFGSNIVERWGGVRCLFGSAVTLWGEKSGGKGRGCVRERIGVLLVVQSKCESQQGRGDKHMRRGKTTKQGASHLGWLEPQHWIFYLLLNKDEISIRAYIHHLHPLVF